MRLGDLQAGEEVFVCGIVRDVTIGSGEQRMRAEHAIAKILAEAPSRRSDAGDSQNRVRDAGLGSSAFCGRWIVGRTCFSSAKAVRCPLPHRSKPMSRTKTFMRESACRAAFWAENAPAWISNVQGDANSRVLASAREQGWPGHRVSDRVRKRR